jgi:hypothetical protein
MRKIGEDAMFIFCQEVDAFDMALKSILEYLTLEERQQFYEDVKRDIRNPYYRLGSIQ